MRPTTQVSGGDRIGQNLRSLRERLQRNSGVYVGVPQGAGQYEDGTPIAVIAAVHEFGSADGHIPERSFLRAPLRGGQDRFKQIFQAGLPQVVSGELSMFQLMSQVGAAGAGTSQEAIAQGISPPNAQSTVDQKGSSTPLVDTGRLRQSITHVVEGDGE